MLSFKRAPHHDTLAPRSSGVSWIMNSRVHYSASLLLSAVTLLLSLAPAGRARAGDPPLAVFHAFDQGFADVEAFVCELARQGYSHVQVAPAQKSNPSREWWARYQPVDYGVIEGKGSEAQLRSLVATAHSCGVKVVADVVFNHMADMPEFSGLDFPGIDHTNFHARCGIAYADGNRTTELDCWLGTLPDLDQSKPAVRAAHEAHLRKLLELGIDGFRFDAAKHIPAAAMKRYVDFLRDRSSGAAWSYLEVIEDGDTKASDYTDVAPVTDFILYGSMKAAFERDGDLRSLRLPVAVEDERSVTFGRTHDNIRELNAGAINPYADRTDALLATTYVLARARGTPLVLNWDNHDFAPIRAGVKFRQIMSRRGSSGALVRENVLAVVDRPTVLVMERGEEGFYVVNKAAEKLDLPALDLTLTHLEGCYRELRNDFNVAIERRGEQKFVTRWGTWSRGGMAVEARDALYFVREPWSQCQLR
jgi:alpha-amylase